MSLLHAVETVLTKAGHPLDYRETTQLVLEQGLWKTAGQTPEATINARLAVDIKQRGSASPFQRTGRGVFALRHWDLPEFVIQLAKPKSSQNGGAHPQTHSASEKVSFSDAAERVLDEFGDKKPMHYRAITKKALELGLLATTGQTPEATMYAQILTEIEKRKHRGELPRFTKAGKLRARCPPNSTRPT
jgi:restriction system protein